MDRESTHIDGPAGSDTRRPVIGLSTSRMADANGAPLAYPVNYAGDDYVQGVLKAGGVPMLLGLHDPKVFAGVVDSQLDLLDGLILVGGMDVSPLSYGEEPHPMLGVTLPERDRMEIALVRRARERGLPVLGVCRGAQVINVALGGTLHQDLPAQRPEGLIQHVQVSDRTQVTHHVDIEPGTRLHGLVGQGRLAVTSFHHQAVKDVGEGLRVVATAPDGVTEAVELADAEGEWLLGVQWHPEMSHTTDAASMAVFRGFVDVCRG